MAAVVIPFPHRHLEPPPGAEEMVTITIRKELWLTLKALAQK